MRRPADRPFEPRQAGVVTSLVAKKGRSDRYVVYLDGTRLFDLAVEVVGAGRAASRGIPWTNSSGRACLKRTRPTGPGKEPWVCWPPVSAVPGRWRSVLGAGFDAEVVASTVDGCGPAAMWTTADSRLSIAEAS